MKIHQRDLFSLLVFLHELLMGRFPTGETMYIISKRNVYSFHLYTYTCNPPTPPHTVSLAYSLSHLFLSYILSYTHTHTHTHTHVHAHTLSQTHTHTQTVMDTHMYKTQTQMAHWPFCLLWTTSRFVHERMWCFWWTFGQPRCHCSSRCLPHLLGQGHFPTEKVNAAHIHFKDMGLNSGGGGKKSQWKQMEDPPPPKKKGVGRGRGKNNSIC